MILLRPTHLSDVSSMETAFRWTNDIPHEDHPELVILSKENHTVWRGDAKRGYGVIEYLILHKAPSVCACPVDLLISHKLTFSEDGLDNLRRGSHWSPNSRTVEDGNTHRNVLDVVIIGLGGGIFVNASDDISTLQY